MPDKYHPAVIPDHRTATWSDVCLTFAERLDEIADLYRMCLDGGPDFVHNQGKPWPARQAFLQGLLGNAIIDATAWRALADQPPRV